MSRHQHDNNLQDFIDAHPLRPVPEKLIAAAGKLLSLDNSNDVSHAMLKLGRFSKKLPRGIDACPVYTFEWTSDLIFFRDDLTYIDHLTSDGKNTPATPDQLKHPFQYAGYNNHHVVVGYDTEFVTLDREIPEDERSGELTIDLKMVSHQFYFSIGIEHICIVLITHRRLTQNAFVRQFLAAALPETMIVYERG